MNDWNKSLEMKDAKTAAAEFVIDGYTGEGIRGVVFERDIPTTLAIGGDTVFPAVKYMYSSGIGENKVSLSVSTGALVSISWYEPSGILTLRAYSEGTVTLRINYLSGSGDFLYVDFTTSLTARFQLRDAAFYKIVSAVQNRPYKDAQ